MSLESAEDFCNVIGFEALEAEETLRKQGFDVQRLEYASKRGVERADSERVIRVKRIGNNIIQITVSRFRTML